MTPQSVRIRTYQVGFGDCFLVTFRYEDGERHLLIDFGSTGLPPEAPKSRMMDIAKDIAATSGGKLTGVVATHRHKDHVSGFATAARGKGTGDIIAALQPELVVQPWTEDPKIDPNATGPAPRAKGLRAASARAATLAAMQATAGNVLGEIKRIRYLAPEARDEIAFLGDDNIGNLEAVRNLMTMGKKSLYAHAGMNNIFGSLLPGVEVLVLGPPTVDQSASVRKQASRNADEYWHLQAAAADTVPSVGRGKVAPLFPGHVRASRNPFPEEARWLMYHLRQVRGQQMLGIVRMLDKAMNNTSLILLFRIGDKSFLFPGDAQWENWAYALSDPQIQELLKDVDVYKVGHHGSLNATPKSLWELFANRSPDPHKHDRLTSIMSTMPGKHGSIASKTEVPRTTLKTELKRESNLLTTDEIEDTTLYRDLEIEL
ncbi:MBL fold metallo-hydrolase [Novosphingobium sp. BL-8A]|uniref:MBL fold metallo-hydrolase n=1 Tax=Novosphingobium sp. BL-8A TaxID=3127639 RepID=UPI003756F1F7